MTLPTKKKQDLSWIQAKETKFKVFTFRPNSLTSFIAQQSWKCSANLVEADSRCWFKLTLHHFIMLFLSHTCINWWTYTLYAKTLKYSLLKIRKTDAWFICQESYTKDNVLWCWFYLRILKSILILVNMNKCFKSSLEVNLLLTTSVLITTYISTSGYLGDMT